MFNTHNSRPPKYLIVQLITCKALGFLNLHRIYRNLQKFTPLFEKFTKIYVIYSANWIWPPPPPPPLFPGLPLAPVLQLFHAAPPPFLALGTFVADVTLCHAPRGCVLWFVLWISLPRPQRTAQLSWVALSLWR